VSNRTRLAQEALLLICLAFLFFSWPIVGVLAAFIFGGRLPTAWPLLVLLTLPAWPLWLLHAGSVALMGTSLLAIVFPRNPPVIELNALCAILNAALIGVPIVRYLRRHAW